MLELTITFSIAESSTIGSIIELKYFLQSIAGSLLFIEPQSQYQIFIMMDLPQL